MGITGGIATGKTTFTKSLRRWLDADVFDADACAKELLESDPAVRPEIVGMLDRVPDPDPLFRLLGDKPVSSE